MDVIYLEVTHVSDDYWHLTWSSTIVFYLQQSVLLQEHHKTIRWRESTDLC